MIHADLIDHPSHLPGHRLKLDHHEDPYSCAGCGDIGFGDGYKCTECNFFLHKQCACPNETIIHPYFPGCLFHFLVVPVDSCRYCDACGQDIKSYNYHCFDERKGWDLHPRCATELPCTIVVEGEELKLRPKLSAKCFRCDLKELGSGRRKTWSYVSDSRKFRYHVSCVDDIRKAEWGKSLRSKE